MLFLYLHEINRRYEYALCKHDTCYDTAQYQQLNKFKLGKVQQPLLLINEFYVIILV